MVSAFVFPPMGGSGQVRMHRFVATPEPGEDFLGVQQPRHQLLCPLEQVLKRFQDPIIPIHSHIQPVVEFGIELSQASHRRVPMLDASILAGFPGDRPELAHIF